MKSPFFVNSFISLVFFTLLCASNQYSFYWIYAKSLFYKFIDMRYSVIIPVYNRPDEVDELLQSLTVQCFKDFEVVIVEDGSSIPCKEVADRYTDRLDIKYFSKPNSGPGQTRNYGAERSEGEYFIILDSDVILPEGYFDAIEKEFIRPHKARRIHLNASTIRRRGSCTNFVHQCLVGNCYDSRLLGTATCHQ